MPRDRWFRVRTDIVDHPKVLGLTDTTFRVLVSLWALARQSKDPGVIYMDPATIARRIRKEPRTVVKCLDRLARPDRAFVQAYADRVVMLGFLEEQYEYPSERPEQVRERQNKHRVVTGVSRGDNGTITGESRQGNEPVTPPESETEPQAKKRDGSRHHDLPPGTVPGAPVSPRQAKSSPSLSLISNDKLTTPALPACLTVPGNLREAAQSGLVALVGHELDAPTLASLSTTLSTLCSRRCLVHAQSPSDKVAKYLPICHKILVAALSAMPHPSTIDDLAAELAGLFEARRAGFIDEFLAVDEVDRENKEAGNP